MKNECKPCPDIRIYTLNFSIMFDLKIIGGNTECLHMNLGNVLLIFDLRVRRRFDVLQIDRFPDGLVLQPGFIHGGTLLLPNQYCNYSRLLDECKPYFMMSQIRPC